MPPQLCSEKYSVKPVSPQQMRDSDIIIKDQDGSPSALEVSDFAYSNSELVNFENAAVNIDNSSDVIIGPVTQFNVNGNITIVQNGASDGEEKDTEKAIYEQKFPQKCENAKLPKAEKSEDQEIKCVYQRKTIIKIAVIAFASFLVICGILALIVILTKAEAKREYVPEIPASGTTIQSHAVFTRADWNGYKPVSVRPFSSPVRLVVIKHVGAGTICNYFETCCKKLQSIQSDDMANGMPDIYCNFFIGGDGNIYVGRGWDAQPERKNDTIDIVFSGNFEVFEPPDEMLKAAKALLKEGEERNKLAPDYVIVPHNQTANTQSPGRKLFKKIQEWPRYTRGLFFNDVLPRASNSSTH